MRRPYRTLVIALISLPAWADAARGRVEARVTGGWAWFLDDVIFSGTTHGAVGGSMRVYVTRRLSIEPEFLYLRKDRTDQDYLFTPNVALDFGPSSWRVVPYIIGGPAWLHHRSNFGALRFSTGSWEVSAGLGVKIPLPRRFFVSLEGRLGTEPVLRTTASFGYSWP